MRRVCTKYQIARLQRFWLVSIGLYFVFPILFTALFAQNLTLTQGMTIDASVKVNQQIYDFSGTSDLKPILKIKGQNIVIDFNNSVIQGNSNPNQPELFEGLGILVEGGSNIQIKNLNLQGYKIGLMAVGTDSLQILNANLSYNYRPKLKSLKQRENVQDELSFQQNQNDEWMRYGMGIYLKNCKRPLIKRVTIKNGFNGLMLHQVENALIYNNNISFNSGVGIALNSSSNNKLMHNKLDWNVRGYSHGFYQKGHNSAGILFYNQANHNTIAYNSATHSGNGLGIWAEESLQNTNSGCNDNMIYRNDFSHAALNGIAFTHSRNSLINNRIMECGFGIWGAYSFDTNIQGNLFAKNNKVAIAMPNSHHNNILYNSFWEDNVGIKLWENNPSAHNNAYQITGNVFTDVRKAFQVDGARRIFVTGNSFRKIHNILDINNVAATEFQFFGNAIVDSLIYIDPKLALGENGNLYFQDNLISPFPLLEENRFAGATLDQSLLPFTLPDGIDTALPETHPRGRQFIMMNEYGPYNFEYPYIFLDKINKDIYSFGLFGKTGAWKVLAQKGFKSLSGEFGILPVTIQGIRDTTVAEMRLEMEYRGASFVTPFGQIVPENAPYRFTFAAYEPRWRWELKFYAYTDANHPRTQPNAFSQLKRLPALKTIYTYDLGFNWWNAPEEDNRLPADRFATFAKTEFTLPIGAYTFEVDADDGVRVFIDGKPVLNRWDNQKPITDTFPFVSDGKKHRIEIEHFDESGFSTLAFRIVGKE